MLLQPGPTSSSSMDFSSRIIAKISPTAPSDTIPQINAVRIDFSIGQRPCSFHCIIALKASTGSEKYDTSIASLFLSHAHTVAVWFATGLGAIDATGDKEIPNLHSKTARSCLYDIPYCRRNSESAIVVKSFSRANSCSDFVPWYRLLAVQNGLQTGSSCNQWCVSSYRTSFMMGRKYGSNSLDHWNALLDGSCAIEGQCVHEP